MAPASSPPEANVAHVLRAAGVAVSFVAASGIAGCTCARKDTTPLTDAGPPVVSLDAALSGPSQKREGLSLPIAAAHQKTGEIVAAGLSAKERAVAVVVFDASGKSVARTRVLEDVKWTADADLRVYDVGDAALVVWHGNVGGKFEARAVRVSRKGEPLGESFAMDVPSCALDDGVAWSESQPSGAARIRSKIWKAGVAVDDRTPTFEDPFVVACGAKRVFALVQPEGKPPFVQMSGGGEPPRVLHHFAATNEAEDAPDPFAFTTGDEVGVVRVGEGGAFVVGFGSPTTPFTVHKEFSERIHTEDDVVAVDADAKRVAIVFTREEDARCDPKEGGATTVSVIDVDRVGMRDTLVELAPSTCGRDFAPFWTGTTANGLVVSWAERNRRAAKTSAPITAIFSRSLASPPGTPARRQAIAADGVADAGCDATKCYTVALLRAPSGDVLDPGELVVTSFP